MRKILMFALACIATANVAPVQAGDGERLMMQALRTAESFARHQGRHHRRPQHYGHRRQSGFPGHRQNGHRHGPHCGHPEFARTMPHRHESRVVYIPGPRPNGGYRCKVDGVPGWCR